MKKEKREFQSAAATAERFGFSFAAATRLDRGFYRMLLESRGTIGANFRRGGGDARLRTRERKVDIVFFIVR